MFLYIKYLLFYNVFCFSCNIRKNNVTNYWILDDDIFESVISITASLTLFLKADVLPTLHIRIIKFKIDLPITFMSHFPVKCDELWHHNSKRNDIYLISFSLLITQLKIQ